MAVILGDLVPRGTVGSSAGAPLEGGYDTRLVTVGATTYAYVASFYNNTVTGFRVEADGTLTAVEGGDVPVVDVAIGLASAVVDGTTYLYAVGKGDDLVAFAVQADGTLDEVSRVTDDATTGFGGANGRVATVATPDGDTFVVVTGFGDNGVTVLRVGAGGALEATDTVLNGQGGATLLVSPADAATAVIDGRTFVFVASLDSNSVTSFELDAATGELTIVDQVVDEQRGATELDRVAGVATATVGGATYVIVGGYEDDGLSVFSVGANGGLTHVSNLEDAADLGLVGAWGVTPFTAGGETFVAVSGYFDGAVTVLHLTAAGVLEPVETAFDGADTLFDGTIHGDVLLRDGRAFVVAPGFDDDGVTVLELGGGDDILFGGDADDDVLLGLGGDDLLTGLDGDDRVYGGADDDTLFGSEGDDVLRGGAGNDFLQGNADDDRLTGDAGADILNGSTGNDVLTGGGGADSLFGEEGADSLSGGEGADVLVGGAGQDRMRGSGGADTFLFEAASDSAVGATRDRIGDFTRGVDLINVQGIDADEDTDGNQAFALADDDGVFEAGEIIQERVGSSLVLSFHVDGDGVADMEVVLKDMRAVTVDDFVL